MKQKYLCLRAWYRYAIVLAVAALLGAPLFAQVNTASLSGLVTDASGAAVVNVNVTVTNTSTGYVRTVTTDNAGYYTFQNLPIGDYTVRVEASGFSTDQGKVTLNVAEKGRRDFALQVGSAQETVQVQSEATGLSPDDASIGTVIGSQTIEQTPLYLRNWDDLLRIVPGVQIARYTQQSGATSAGRTGDFNVNGIHSLQNNFILDGIDNNTFSENVQELSTESAHPSVDVIAEFNIITNPYSAEYGRAPGAAVSVNTKGGTNQFHGLAYEYIRNNYFDANDWISNHNHLRKPENNQNQFGGNFGGPIMKNRLFGFFNYEGTRIKQGVSRTATVPLDNERIGDFSPATGAIVGVKYPTIYDPQTCLPNNPQSCQPFPNNQIPAGRIDPVVAKLIALFPEPNASGELNNFVRNALAQDNTDNYDGRVDWTPSQNNSFFARYNYSNRFRFIPGYLGGLADGSSTSAWGRQYLKNHSLVLGWTHVFSASMVNDFRFGWVRNSSFAEQDPFALDQFAGDFVPGIPVNPAVGGGVPQTTFTNYGFLGSPDFLPKQQVPQQYQYNDTLSITRGRQTFKVGGSLYLPMRNLFQDEPGMRGDLTFNGQFTCQRNGGSQCVSNTGFSYADGLLGLVQYNQLTNVHFVDQRLWMLSGFFEDDWKVTPQLTLNLGLRYDFATPALNAKDQMANFDPDSGSLVFARSGGLKSRALVNPNYKNFGPRFGFAYSPDQKTVVRGGYGIYYTVFERYGSEDQLSLNPPFLINKTQSAASTSTTPVMIAQQGFPSNYLDPSTINLNSLTSFHIRAMNSNDPTPYVQQWSFGIQRAIGVLTADVNYVGTKSTHLDLIRDYNQPLIAGNAVQTTTDSSGRIVPVIPYSNFGQIEYTDPIGFGNYNGLQAGLNGRFRNGLSVRAAYTYSHSLDNAPEELESNSGDAPNGRNAAAWYGNSDFDIRHRVAVSYVYELPFGHGKPYMNHGPMSWILGDFRTSGVYTFYSGHPITVNSGGTLNSALDPYGFAVAPPFVIGKPHIVGDPSCWYFVAKNKACTALAPTLSDAYALPAAGTFGNSGRNTIIGPRTDVFDAALLREFPIERVNIEFRWEVFNVTNTPEFGQPSNNFSSSAGGSITSLSGDPRVMQFALRLSF
jgi:Carboxypeptidase regulatory-like domain/TonB-dependent Receptor Plug Domain